MSITHPSSAEFDAHQRQGWYSAAEAMGIVAAAMLVDSAPAIFNRLQEARAGTSTSSTPEVFEHEGGSNKAILYLTGCDQYGNVEAKKAGEVFKGLGHVITPVYDKYDVCPKNVADQIIGACDDLAVEEIVIMGGSMGLGIAMRAARQQKFRDRFPKARGVIGNAPVIEQVDIARNYRLALHGAQAVRYSFAMNKLYSAVSALRDKPVTVGQYKLVVPRLPSMPPREISRYAHAVSSHLPDGCLQGFVDPENLWLIDNMPGDENKDRVAIIEQSYKDIKRVSGFAPQVVSDPERPPHSHVASLRYPTIPRQLVEWSLYPERRPSAQLQAA